MLARRLALAIALVAGLIGSQGPEFAQQYRQRIGGALDELKQIVAAFDAEAASEHMTPPQAIQRLEANGDALAVRRGEDIAQATARAIRLQQQLEAMASAGPLGRLIVMAENFDPQIARRALDNFEPATPLTGEALTIAGIAAVFAWAATHLLFWPIRRLSPPREDRRRWPA